MPIYQYIHPESGEIFEVLRPIKDRNKKYKSPDGVKCNRIIDVPGYCGLAEKEREGFQMDPDLYKKRNPKLVRYRDGHKEKFDPNRHC